MDMLWPCIAVTAVSLTGAVLAWQAHDTKQLLARMEARHLAHQAIAQGILDRMDRAAEQRDREHTAGEA